MAVWPSRSDGTATKLVAADGRRIGAEDARHLSPVEPSKIVCVHLNYESRRAEFGAKLAPAPTYFHKPTSALNAHGGDVVRPPRCRFLNYEGEIAIVIGRETTHIAPEDAGGHILGYTVANDYGLSRDFRDTDAGSMPGEGLLDTCPLGPAPVRTGTSTAKFDPICERQRCGRTATPTDEDYALPWFIH